MKNKKIKNIELPLCILALSILIYIIMTISNNNYIKKYISNNYPNYVIIEEDYKYLDNFWSTWYDTKHNMISKEIICNTHLKNKNTGMYITIPFYHPRFGLYRPSEYGKKDIKELVNEYEKYWNNINELKNKYLNELNVSDAIIIESSNEDIYQMIVYIKYKKDLDIYNFVQDIDKIKTNIQINNIHYIIAKEDAYNHLKPWTESNDLIALKGMKRVNDNINFDVIDIYKYGNKWNTVYYKINNNTW